jgi:hypothetical protein
MTRSLNPFRFVLIALSGWMNQQQLELINYLREENRVLREQLGGKRYGSTMTRAADWPPRLREWEGSFFKRWPRSSRPRLCGRGIAG